MRLGNPHRRSSRTVAKPILNSPYEYPRKHWELDEAGQPTQKVIENRRNAKFITPIPKPKKHKKAAQKGFAFDVAIFLASYIIDKRADFLSRQQHVAFLGGIDHTAIADDIVRCGYLYRKRP
jgi:hypothetical protein